MSGQRGCSLVRPIFWIRLAWFLVLPKISRLAFPTHTSRFCLTPTIWYWRIRTLCSVSKSGHHCIDIRMEKIFPLREARSCFSPLRKRQKYSSFVYRENVEQRRNTGHMTAPPSPAVQRCSSRSNTGRTRMRIICHKSIWRWYLERNRSFHFTIERLQVICRM